MYDYANYILYINYASMLLYKYKKQNNKIRLTTSYKSKETRKKDFGTNNSENLIPTFGSPFEEVSRTIFSVLLCQNLDPYILASAIFNYYKNTIHTYVHK